MLAQQAGFFHIGRFFCIFAKKIEENEKNDSDRSLTLVFHLPSQEGSSDFHRLQLRITKDFAFLR